MSDALILNHYAKALKTENINKAIYAACLQHPPEEEPIKILYHIELIETAKPHSEIVHLKNVIENISSIITPTDHPFVHVSSEEFIGSLVKTHLMKVDISDIYSKNIKQGKLIVPTYHEVKGVDFYLETRDGKRNEDLEGKLSIILEWGGAILRQDIDVGYLKSLKIRVPKIGEPYHV